MDNSFDEEVEIEKTSNSTSTSSISASRVNAIWIVGIAALSIGLVLGYIGRGAFGPEAMAARGTATADAAAIQTRAVEEAGAVQTRAVANAEIMQMLIAQTRHFKGDPNAKVTLIEFSDFQ